MFFWCGIRNARSCPSSPIINSGGKKNFEGRKATSVISTNNDCFSNHLQHQVFKTLKPQCQKKNTFTAVFWIRRGPLNGSQFFLHVSPRVKCRALQGHHGSRLDLCLRIHISTDVPLFLTYGKCLFAFYSTS